MTKHHLTLFLGIISSVSAACLSYTVLLRLLQLFFTVNVQHEAGYICSMLFIIPGFPFITSGIDLAKLDMRSGMERLMYSLIIITVATMTAWILAMVLGLKPMPFLPLKFALWQWIILRLLASFGGVFGFSILFNSPIRLAAAAGVIGAVSNTFRLELIDLASFPPAVAAFAGAFVAGIFATTVKGVAGYPRISIICGDNNTLRRCDKADACDGELAGEDYHDDPDAAPALAHECEQSGSGEHFIGERIEKLAENGNKIILSCNLAVEHIGQRRDCKNGERDYVMIRELNKHQREIPEDKRPAAAAS